MNAERMLQTAKLVLNRIEGVLKRSMWKEVEQQNEVAVVELDLWWGGQGNGGGEGGRCEANSSSQDSRTDFFFLSPGGSELPRNQQAQRLPIVMPEYHKGAEKGK